MGVIKAKAAEEKNAENLMVVKGNIPLGDRYIRNFGEHKWHPEDYRGSELYMKTVCSWCNKVIRAGSLKPCSDNIISHGICNECLLKILWPNNHALLDFFEDLEAPVVVINSLGNLSSANKSARELLQKELPDIEGFQCGNVFECVYSKLPEGCGKTIHCDSCTIRNTVMNTMQSSKSHLKIPAILHLGTIESVHEVQLLISTEKVEDVVLMRIDSFSYV